MPTIAQWNDLIDHPQPVYPEAAQVRELARARCPQFVDPRNLYPEAEAVGRRGGDWVMAVLGRPVAGSRYSMIEQYMLIVADEMDLDPPLHPMILEQRAEDAERRAAYDAARAAERRRDEERSAAAIAACRVQVEKRPNTQGRRYGAYDAGPLVHIVPVLSAVSGSRRAHPAGRALCETPSRHKPRILGEPTDDPATCVACLDYAPKIRRAL